MGLARCLTYKHGEDGSLLLAFGVGDGCFLALFLNFYLLVAPVFSRCIVCYVMCFVAKECGARYI